MIEEGHEPTAFLDSFGARNSPHVRASGFNLTLHADDNKTSAILSVVPTERRVVRGAGETLAAHLRERLATAVRVGAKVM